MVSILSGWDLYSRQLIVGKKCVFTNYHGTVNKQHVFGSFRCKTISNYVAFILTKTTDSQVGTFVS